MKKQTNTKRALIMSLLSMLLCLTMLIGSTMAWFTDTVTNEDNRIKSGTLEIALLKYNGTEYVDISNGKGNIFNDGSVTTGDNLAAATEWEPGKTEIAFLKVENKGRLSVKYDISLNITNDDTTNAAGTTDVKLTDMLQYAIIDDLTAAQYAAAYPQAADASWDAILKTNGAQSGDVKAGIMTAAPGGKLWPQKDFANEEDKYSDYFMLAVHMDENATSVYEDLSTIIDVTINATQLPYEEDSFGSEYDADTTVQYELIKNGGFEETSDTSWSGNGTIKEETDNHYLEQSGTSTCKYTQEFLIDKDFLKEKDRVFTLNADLNKTDTLSYAQISIEAKDATGTTVGEGGLVNGKTAQFSTQEATVGLQSITSIQFKITSETVKVVVTVTRANGESNGEAILWDNISITTPVEAVKLAE